MTKIQIQMLFDLMRLKADKHTERAIKEALSFLPEGAINWEWVKRQFQKDSSLK